MKMRRDVAKVINVVAWASQPNHLVAMLVAMEKRRLEIVITIATVELEYEGESYTLVEDFGKDYPEEAAIFMFTDGNYGCDCNLSLLINRQCDAKFPELECGKSIIVKSINISKR